MFFWLFKICALSLPQRRSLKYYFYFENSQSFKWVKSCKLRSLSWNDGIEEAESIFTGLWITFWWLFKVRWQQPIRQISTRVFLKAIISCCLQHGQHLEFQKTTPAHAFCFCLGVSHSFASDTSPKWIDREGLGKRRTGSRQRMF